MRSALVRGPDGAIGAERHEHAGGAPFAQRRRCRQSLLGRLRRGRPQDEPALALIDDEDVRGRQRLR